MNSHVPPAHFLWAKNGIRDDSREGGMAAGPQVRGQGAILRDIVEAGRTCD